MATKQLESVKCKEGELAMKERELRKARAALAASKKAALETTAKCLEAEMACLEAEIEEKRKAIGDLIAERGRLDRSVKEHVAANLQKMKEVETELELSSKRHVLESASVFLKTIDNMGLTRISVPVDQNELGVFCNVSDGVFLSCSD